MEKIQSIIDNLHVTKIADQEIDLTLLFPRYYKLSSPASTELQNQFLSLVCGGSSMISSPFSVLYPQNHFFMLLYTKSGGVRLHVDDKTISLTADSLILLPMEHSVYLQSLVLPWVYEIYYIDASSFPAYETILAEQFIFCSTHEHPEILPDLSILKTYPGTISLADLFDIHAHLTEIFTLCCKSAIGNSTVYSDVPSYLVEIHNMIHEHYNQNMSLSALEMQFLVSRYRICREYTRFYGISPLKDQTLQRLNHAKKLLLIPDMNIQDISSQIGYENVTHFIKLFKKYFQITPGAFRQTVLVSQSTLH